MMPEKMAVWLESLSPGQCALWGLLLSLGLELVTIICRFGLGWKAAKHTRFLARFTFRWRIHHGYVGVLALVLAAVAGNGLALWSNALFVLGTGLLVSDVVHHFLVLWPVTGSPGFDLRYPPGKRQR